MDDEGFELIGKDWLRGRKRTSSRESEFLLPSCFSFSALRMCWSYLSPQPLSGGAGEAKIGTLRQNQIKQYLELQGEEFVLEAYSLGEPVEIFGKIY